MNIPIWLILFVAISTIALYRFYRYGELQRKAASYLPAKENKFLRSGPIGPKHAVPKLRRWGIPEPLRRFFADFEQFRVLANEWAPIKDTPWRLQELADTRLGTPNENPKKRGRRYDVFYNRERAGLLEITDAPGYSTGEPRVRTHVLIPDARLIPLDDVSRFLTSIATLLSGGTGEEYAESRRSIEAALDQAHEAKRWGRLKGGSATLEVLLLGSAVTYKTLRARHGEEAK
jgi:hypothetical protein